MSKPIIMWAAIVKSQKSEWIEHCSLRYLKRECKAEYLNGWHPDDYKWLLARVRFARVEVKEIA